MASSSDDQSSRQPPLRRPPATGPGLNTKSAATTVGSSWDEFLRLIQGSGFIFACRVSGAALTLLTQILLARWMGAAELGVYVLGFSWCVLLGTMSTLGFSPAAMRFINLGLARGESGYIKAFIRHSIRLISIASMTVAVTGLTLIWTVLELDRDKALTLSVALAIVPVFSLLHFICATANGYSRFALGFLPTSVLRPATFCCLVALWWWSGATLHAPVAMGLQATAIVVVVLPTALYFRGFIRSQDSHAETPPEPRLWLRTSLSLLIGAIFTGYFPEIIIILSGTILPSDELALLHVSFRIAMLVSFGLFAIDAFTAPDAARLYAAGDRPGLEAVVNRATRLRFLVSLIAVLAFVVLGRWVLSLFGPEFVAGYPLLLILAFGQLVQGAVGPVVRLMSISGHQDHCLIVFAVSLAVATGLIAALAPQFGAGGAAVAASLAITIWALWMRRLSVRHLKLAPRIW